MQLETKAYFSPFGSIIEPQKEKYLRLTHPQKRILITENTNPGTGFANMPFTVIKRGDVDFNLLEHAINEIIKQNDGLRIKLAEVDLEIVQYVSDYQEKKLDFFDFSSAYGNEKYNKWLNDQKKKPFKLIDSDLYYFALIKFSPEESGFYFNMHHIIGDGASIAIILNDIVEIYNKLLKGEQIDEKKRPSYINFVSHEEDYLNSTAFESDRCYWMKKFEELPEPIKLSYDKPVSYGIEAKHKEFLLDPVLSDRIYNFSLENKTNLFRLYMTSFFVYASRISMKKDITIGFVNHNRSTPDEKEMVGMFANAFALRKEVDQDIDALSFLRSTDEELKYILKNHVKYPFDQLVNDLRSVHTEVPNLIDIILVGHEAMHLGEFTAEYRHSGFEQPPYSLLVNIFFGKTREEKVTIQYVWPKNIYDEQDIDRIHRHILNITEDMISNPSKKISSLSVLSGNEKDEILNGFNKTDINYRKDVIFVELFAEQVKKNPDNIAVVYKDQKLTYRELDKKTSSLAALLKEKGAIPDKIIGIMLNPCLDMFTAIIAALKSGAAYMPIDPKYSPDRIKYMLEDSKTEILIAQKELISEIKEFKGEIIELENAKNYNLTPIEQIKNSEPQNLAYIIYTSGSTGNPKGVMIEQRSLVNMCFWYNDHCGMTEKDSVSKFAGFGFDASILEIFPPLAAGAAIHIISEDIKYSPKLLNDYFEKNGITVSFLPTQFFEQFLDMVNNRSLRLVDTGGDKLKHFKPANFKIINGYGPTEHTVACTSFTVDKNYHNIPIGKPIANTKIYILDSHNNIQPVGIPGELCVTGAGIARGYLEKPDLTAEKFVDDPFRPGFKMYRTGDLARWLPDGNIEFLGRIDFQLKIRGFRIELGEIEHKISAIDGIKDVVVVAREDSSGEKYLAAYYESSADIDQEKIKSILSEELPYYMILAFFVKLDKLPITPNGKVDRKALPDPHIFMAASEYAPPTTRTEEILVELWKEILGLDKVGINDDFFAIGGHSLKAVQLQSRIENMFGVEISFNDIFSYPTIKKLAEQIKSANKINVLSIEHVPEKDHYAVTSAQKRLFFIEQMKNYGTTYNVPLLLDIDGRIDKERLINAIDALIARHEPFRTSFEVIDGEPVQRVYESIKYKKNYREVEEQFVDSIICDFIRPFDLSKPPLFRLELLKIAPEKHILLLDVHHTIFDGSSMVILVKELADLYNGKPLAELSITYKDFAEWQKKLLVSDSVKKQEDFWLDKFSGSLPILDMSTDFPRPSVMTHEGDRFTSVVDADILDELKKFASATGVTLYMVLMAALNVLLAKYSHQEEIITGAGVAGRNHSGTENLIGMFVNTLPIRTFPEDKKQFLDYLKEVKEMLLGAYENQDYQFEQLIEKLNLKRDSSRNPLFDVALVLQSMGFPKVEIAGAKMKPREFNQKIAHIDLMLEAIEDESRLFINWEYSTVLYKKQTVERIAEHFKNILKSIIEDPKKKLKDITLLSNDEEEKLLYTFNRTAADYPTGKTVHQIFEEQVEKYPDRTAVIFEDKRMTYKELNERANQLAHFLKDKGVKPDTIIGLMLDKSFEMIVAIIAIIKSGGCYLPIKPDFPQDRINYMLENSEAPILLTTPEHYDLVKEYNGQIYNLLDESIYLPSKTNPENTASPENLIYIIYTSGSTGKPKGVMLKHINIARLFKNSMFNSGDNYYNTSENDVWSMFHSFCFDFSVWEMYGALLWGGAMVIIPTKAAKSPADFLKILKENKVTILSQTPGAFYNLIEEDLKSDDRDLSIRYVTFGGEALKPGMLRCWHEKYPEARLINMYGITETTVHVTYKEITSAEIASNQSNIGVPIPTLTTYVMDRNLKLCPIGVPGEICVGGLGVARGYLGRPDLTEKVFVKNTYNENEIIYRSGDLAKMLPNGEMEYLGRLDFQVKIRGFRIELGEIENRLLKHPEINKAVVIAKDDETGAKFLAAYIETTRKLTVSELREYLLKELPDYMVPSYFINLEKMPLTPNGKVDRKALPEPDTKIETGSEFIDARNETEKKIAEAFKRVLGLERVSILDNFFALGGHSLRAVTLVVELQKYFEVNVNDIFECQTVSALAAKVKPRKDDLRARISELKKLAAQPVAAQSALEKKVREEYKERYKPYETINLSKEKKYENVLVTGTTGYLGIHILKELLENKKCTAWTIIRAKTEQEAKERLKAKTAYYFGADFFEKYKDRIRVLSGNLGKEKMGLTEAVYNNLAQTIDCIINSAALVKHYGHYQEFYESNVDSVKNLVELSKNGKKKDLNHVSTLSVIEGYVEGKDHVFFSEYDYDIGQKSDNYYVRTKTEAEKVLENARNEGVNANIYRVGNISINSISGLLQDNIEENAFYLQVKSFINLGVIPDSQDEVELSFVDYLSNAIIRLFDKEELHSETYHLLNSNFVKLSDIITSDEAGLNVQKVSFDDFIDFIYKNYEKQGYKKYIENVMLHRGWLGIIGEKPGEVSGKTTSFTILSDKTNLLLDRLGFAWPELDIGKMSKMIIEALSDRISFMKKAPIFSLLSADQLQSVAKMAKYEIFEDESDLLWEGDPSNNFYLIVKGNVELSRHSRAGWLGTIGILGSGNFIGESGILCSGSVKSPVIAEAVMGDVDVLSFKAEQIAKIIREDHQLTFGLLCEMNRRLVGLETMMVNMG